MCVYVRACVRARVRARTCVCAFIYIYTKSTRHSSSIVSTLKELSRCSSATEKRSLWPFIRETPFRK